MRINAGSGQCKFEGWTNVDINPKWEPDVCCDMCKMPFDSGSASIIVSHHTVEHLWPDHAMAFAAECHRLLKPRGSLLVFCPDMEALANAWLAKEIDDQTYMTNVYGAYRGEQSDRHWWGYVYRSLASRMSGPGWSMVKKFDWRKIEGAKLACDWWVLAMEFIK